MAKTPKVTKAAGDAPPQVNATPSPIDAAQEAAAKARAEKTARMANDRFFRCMDDSGKPVQPVKKLPPQAQCIVNTIEAAGEEGITRVELVKNLKGVLVTRQPEARILAYYVGLIQSSGAVRLVEGGAETPAS